MGRSKRRSSSTGGSALSSPGSVKKYEDMYMGMDLSQNPYADLTNVMSGVENPYAQAENVYAGMTNPYGNLANAYQGMGNVYSDMENQFEGAQDQWAGMKSQFEGMENEFANLENHYANVKNQYAGMENRMEEIGISTEAADFAAEKQAQSRADIMSALSGAAGGSGISGLAQTLANQASEDARASSADIAKQEVENEKLRLQESSRIDMLQRGEASKLDMMRAGEEARIDQLKAQGEMDVEKTVRGERAEIDRLQRGSQERMQDRRLGEAARIDQLRRGYEGDMDRLVRGEQSRLDYLSAQGAYDLAKLQRGEDARLQDQYLSTEMQLDLAERGMDHEIQMKEREGDMYTQQLELDRISTLLQGSLSAGAARAAAGAKKKSSSKGLIGALAPVAKTVVTKGAMSGCIPKGVCVDTLDGQVAVESIKPGDIIVGYDGQPTKVLQKHEYLEDSKEKGFYKVTFKNSDGSTSDVVVSGCHRIMGERAQNITKNVVSKEIHGGVTYSYDLLTEDLGYRMNGIPVDSMIGEKAEIAVKLKEIIEKTRELEEMKNN